VGARTRFSASDNSRVVRNEIELFRLRTNWLQNTIAHEVEFVRFRHGACSLADISSNSRGIGLLEFGKEELFSQIPEVVIIQEEAQPAPPGTPKGAQGRADPPPPILPVLRTVPNKAELEKQIKQALENLSQTPSYIENFYKHRIISRRRETSEKEVDLCWMTGFKMPCPFDYLLVVQPTLQNSPRRTGPYWQMMILESTNNYHDIRTRMRSALKSPLFAIEKPKDL